MIGDCFTIVGGMQLLPLRDCVLTGLAVIFALV